MERMYQLLLTVLVLWTVPNPEPVLSFNLEPTLPVIKRGEASSYFGFSVAQHSTVNGTRWLLAGAPQGQNLQPNTTKSGALFKCPMTGLERDCVQVVTDGKRGPIGDEYYERPVNSGQLFPPLFNEETKEDQWLGVIVRSQGSGRKVVVCAHRYVIGGRRKDYRWGIGLCHFLDDSLEFLDTIKPCSGKTKSFEEQGLCQAGTSAFMLEDDTALIGAPGAYTARGILHTWSVKDNFLERDRRYESPILDTGHDRGKYVYLGMSVVGAKFYGDQYTFVAGAPKGDYISGQVYFFSKGNSTTLDIRTVLTGESFASSFGYELATLDLNGDKRPDLVVGAPFYADNRDSGGAVYVYLNPPGGFTDNTPYVRLTGPSESRFGLAISTIGDLNKDGFDDLAVGAPYADDGHGIVYVYLGSPDGVIREPSQVIKAKDHFPYIRTFGYSLSGGMDLDENSYPDLLVGAYSTDYIVLLRSRPIIDLKTDVKGDLSHIDPNKFGCPEDPYAEEVCFGFEACFEIRDLAQVQSTSLVVNYTIEAETFAESKKFSRVIFRNTTNGQESQVVVKSIRVWKNQASWQCTKEVAYVKNGTKDIQTPVAFKLTYTLEQSKPEFKRNNRQLPIIQNYPILNQQEASKIFVARFEKDCGEDETCMSDLSVKATVPDLLPFDETKHYQLVLGERQELLLNVNLQNLGEPAYEAMLYVAHPKSMPYIGTDTKDMKAAVSCSPAVGKNDLVSCSLGNPYKNRSAETLILRFSAKNLQDIESTLDFKTWVNTTSYEEEDHNNRDEVVVTVIKKAELGIYGQSNPGKVFYGGKVTGESAIKSTAEIGPRITHEYSIYNAGPWKASVFYVDIWWPHQVENRRQLGKWLLYPEAMPSVEGDVQCKVPENSIDVLKVHSRSKRWVQDEHEIAEIKVLPQTETSSDGKVTTFVEMNCVRGSAKCFLIECTVKNLLAKESAVIKIHSRLWNGTLVEEYPAVDEVRIRSKARIRIADDIRQDPVNDVAMALTTCVPDLKLKGEFEGIAWWIYALSIILGILLLALIVYCLYRQGFFKRRRPEQRPTHTASVSKNKK